MHVCVWQGRLGGGEGIEGLYGSLKRMSMQKVLDCLACSCELSSKSHLVDIGAGLGRCALAALRHCFAGGQRGTCKILALSTFSYLPFLCSSR